MSGRELGLRDFNTAQAFAHFLVWRYISRSGRWRAEADDIAQAEVDAPMYAQSITINNKIRSWD